MNATQVHLAITHLPVFGLFLGFLALVYGVIKKSKDVNVVALVVLIISVVGGIIAFQTGESAEDSVERIATVYENSIEAHEESAEITVILFYALGALSLMVLAFQFSEKKFARQMLFIVLVMNIIAFSSVARTASLGGNIRHTEITKNPPAADKDTNSSHEEDD